MPPGQKAARGERSILIRELAWLGGHSSWHRCPGGDLRLEAWRSDTLTEHSVSDPKLPVSLGCFLAILLGRDIGDSQPNRTDRQTARNDDSPWPPNTRPTPSHITNGQNGKTAPGGPTSGGARGGSDSIDGAHGEMSPILDLSIDSIRILGAPGEPPESTLLQGLRLGCLFPGPRASAQELTMAWALPSDFRCSGPALSLPRPLSLAQSPFRSGVAMGLLSLA